MTAGGIIQLLASAARTAAVQSEEQKSDGSYKGILLIVDSTASADTPSITPSIQAYNPVGAEWVTIWTAAAAITGAANTTYLLYPAASGGNMTEVDGIPIPIWWRLSVAVADADSITYSAVAHLLP
jgi:hypothetical protein